MLTSAPAPLLLLGHVTLDLAGGNRRLGGSVTYAAKAALLLHRTCRMLTSAPRALPELAPLRDQPGLELRVVESDAPTTFRIEHLAEGRRLTLVARANDLRPTGLRPDWRSSPLCLALPVADECPPSLIAALRPSMLVLGLQGWLRAFTDDGEVRPRDVTALSWIHAAAPTLVTFSEEDHPEAVTLATSLARDTPVVALTRGCRGSTLWVDGRVHEIAPASAIERDPTGAGDVFTLLLALGLDRGLAPVAAAERASFGAARVVEGRGLGTLASVATALET